MQYQTNDRLVGLLPRRSPDDFDENGKPVINQQGELVCTAPAPSMPVYFWDDPDGSKYHAAYFDVYPGVWRHGVYIEINDHGGVTIYGRSDATLNPACAGKNHRRAGCTLHAQHEEGGDRRKKDHPGSGGEKPGPLKNPEIIYFYANIAELKEDR